MNSFVWFHSVPEGVEDNISGALQFAENFFLRYGNVVPNFYIGSLKDAIDEVFIETDDVVSLWSWQTTFICFLLTVCLIFISETKTVDNLFASR